jgi:hypothetical protein
VVIFAATGVILSAAYMLWLYGRIIFGALVKPALMAIQDLSAREIAILAPLVALTIAFGVYPKPIFDVTSVSVANLVEQHKLALRAGAGEKMVRGDAEARRSGPGSRIGVVVENGAPNARSNSSAGYVVLANLRGSASPRANLSLQHSGAMR